MAVDLDEFDLHIVDILLRDGRLPASQIAEMVGLSRPAVVERIDKLERNGVIRGTTILVDPATLGRTVTRDDCYLIKVRTSSIATLNALVAKLIAPPLSLSTRTTIVMKTHFEKIGGVPLGEDA